MAGLLSQKHGTKGQQSIKVTKTGRMSKGMHSENTAGRITTTARLLRFEECSELRLPSGDLTTTVPTRRDDADDEMPKMPAELREKMVSEVDFKQNRNNHFFLQKNAYDESL
uniref:Uncharacterized protein n=1 Tax=Panagrellus redivivus TaxID=6233 RepID=A0A7E4UXA5_PANRE